MIFLLLVNIIHWDYSSYIILRYFLVELGFRRGIYDNYFNSSHHCDSDTRC